MAAAEKGQRSSPLRLVDFVEGQDLRYVNWNQDFLKTVQKDYNLSHGEAVVYCNANEDRIRLVAHLYQETILLLPPVDSRDQLSAFLKTNLFLRKFRINSKVNEAIAYEVETAKERIAKRKKAAANARARRSK